MSLDRFLREASFTLTRRAAGKPDKVWLESGLYPSYYLNSWHYQTDGWLSEESAKVYEASTETVFVGKHFIQSTRPPWLTLGSRSSVLQQSASGMSLLSSLLIYMKGKLEACAVKFT